MLFTLFKIQRTLTNNRSLISTEHLNRKIRYLTAGSAERRLALYLSSFESETVELDASISSLSELLDIGRASLYRAFDTLIADGYIQKDGRTIHILDPDAMIQDYQ